MSNIDEKAKNNFTIEMRIFENYEKVKHEIIKAIDFLRHAETNLGMCKIFYNQDHGFWHSVIKPWFQPERFGITHLWFPSGFSHIGYGEYNIIRSNRWLKTPIDRINPEDMMRIEPLLEGGDRLWCIEIQKYYVFFYEVRKGRRILGKGRIKEILDIIL